MGARRPRSGMVGRSPTDADHVSHRSWAFAGVVSVWYEGFRRCPIEVTWRREWSHGRDHPAGEWRAFGADFGAAEDAFLPR